MKAFLFPGQGSQKKGMGQDLFDRYPIWVAEADAILGYSIKTLCLEDPHNQLKQTQFTQPALFVVNALTGLSLMEKEGPPAMVAGHSLGEFNALLAAGVMDFSTGLKLVKKRGELMGAARGGGMAAVVGLEPDQIRAVLKAQGAEGLDVANFNEPGQTVISGPVAELERVQGPMEAAGAMRCLLLPVSAAFHSRYMAPASQEFGSFVSGFHFRVPGFPVIANVTAKPYLPGQVPEMLTRQIRESVQWTESMRLMMGCGVTDIKECGPGEVLTNLWRAIKRKTTPIALSAAEIARIFERPAPAPAPVRESAPVPVREPAPAPAPVREPAPAPVREPVQQSATTAVGSQAIAPQRLGNAGFRHRYGLSLAYLAGSMHLGVSGSAMVIRLGQAGLMGFLGTAGLPLLTVEHELKVIQSHLRNGESYGVNLLTSWENPQREAELVQLLLRMGVSVVEAAGYLSMTAPVVQFRFKGARVDGSGRVVGLRQVIAKVSRPEVSQAFLSPPPERILKKLLTEGKLTEAEVALARGLPVCSDLVASADSGGHTDLGSPYTLLPTLIRQRDELARQYGYEQPLYVGAAGGIGTPEAALAAFMLGADFVMTGSINQCTPEAATSQVVKDLLQSVQVQDTDYAPAGDLFELGAKVQVLKKGVFFPARANKLFELYSHYESWEAIDAKTRETLEQRYFRRPVSEVWREVKEKLSVEKPELLAVAEREPRQKLALLCRWYCEHSLTLAMSGSPEQKVDYQIYCGPAMGAFNQCVKGTLLEDWRARHVDTIAEFLMKSTAELLQARMSHWQG